LETYNLYGLKKKIYQNSGYEVDKAQKIPEAKNLQSNFEGEVCRATDGIVFAQILFIWYSKSPKT
jgi:hypothetical protein